MNKSMKGGFPNPLAKVEEKLSEKYGLQYAKAMLAQWGGLDNQNSIYGKRYKEFERARAYAAGTQDTSIYKQILNSLDPDNGDGSLMSLDWSPV